MLLPRRCSIPLGESPVAACGQVLTWFFLVCVTDGRSQQLATAMSTNDRSFALVSLLLTHELILFKRTHRNIFVSGAVWSCDIYIYICFSSSGWREGEREGRKGGREGIIRI